MAEFDIDQYIANAIADNQKQKDDEAKAITLAEAKRADVVRKSAEKKLTFVEAVNKAYGTEPKDVEWDGFEGGLNKALNLIPRGASSVVELARGAYTGIVDTPVIQQQANKIMQSPEDIDLFNAATNPYTRDNLTPAQLARLNEPLPRGRERTGIVRADRAGGEYGEGDFSQIDNLGMTRADYLKDFIDRNKKVADRAEKYNIRDLVNRTEEEDYLAREKSSIKEVEDAYKFAERLRQQDKFKGALATASAFGQDVAGIAKSVIDNPSIIPAAIADNAADFGAAALGPLGAATVGISHFGRGTEAFAKGMQKVRKDTGNAFPTAQEFSDMNSAAVVAPLLDSVGDLTIGGSIKAARDSAKGANKAADSATTASGLSTARYAGTRQVAEKTAKGTGTETFTEYLQSPLENIAEYEDFSKTDQWLSTAMAAGAGGTTSGVSAVAEVRGQKRFDASKEAYDRETAAKDFVSAVEKNDPSIFLDPESDKYDPVKATAALYTAARQKGSDYENLSNNLEKVTDIEATIVSSVAADEETLRVQSPEVRADLANQRQELQASLDPNLDPLDYAQRKSEIDRITAILDTPVLNQKQAQGLFDKLTKQQDHLERIGNYRKMFEIDINAPFTSDESTTTSSDSTDTTSDTNSDSQDSAEVKKRQADIAARQAALDAKAAKEKEAADAKLAEEKAAAGAAKAKRTEDRAKPFPIFEGKLDFDVPTGLIQDNEEGVKAVLNRSSENMAAAGGLTLREAVSALIPAEKVNVERGRYSDADLQSLLREEVDAYNAKLSQQSAKPQDAGKDSSVSDVSSVDTTVDSTKSTESTQSTQSTLAPKGDVTDITPNDPVNKGDNPNVLINQSMSDTAVDPTQEGDTEAPARKPKTSITANDTVVEIDQHSAGDSNSSLAASDDGAITYAGTSTKEGATPTKLVLNKKGKLVSAETAVKDGKSTNTAWIPPNQEAANEVRGLLEERAATPLNSKERREINNRIAETVLENGDKPGMLRVFLGEKSPKGTDITKRNTFVDFFSQDKGGKDGRTFRPMVMVKDFLSKLTADNTLANKYAKKPLSDQQMKAIKGFTKFANEWKEDIRKGLIARDAPEYFQKNDPLQFLYIQLKDENGNPTGEYDVDENFKTAIALGAFAALQDLNSKGKLNTAKEINKILGREDDQEVTAEEFELFSKLGTRDVLLRNSAGLVAYQALGLKPNKDAKIEYEPKIIAALGAHVEKLLLERGYITRDARTAASMAEYMQATATVGNLSADPSLESEGYKGTELLSFYEMDFENKDINNILDSVKQTQNILEKVFSVEAVTKQVTLEPDEFDQKTVNKSDRETPDSLYDVLKQKQKEANKLRIDIHNLLEGFDRESVLLMAGKTDATKVHIDRVASVEATNEGLERDLNNFLELAEFIMSNGTKELDQPFYYRFSPWKNHRVGNSTSNFNPQTSKLHRNLAYQPDWETEVDINNAEQMANFMLRVGEGLGFKTDSKPSTSILKEIETFTKTQPIADAAALLNRRENDPNNEPFTAEEQSVIVNAVALGKENMLSFNSLVALSQLKTAVDKGITKFTTQLPAEVDGKVNGTMLTVALFGGQSISSMFTALNRGGFYELGSKFKQFNFWKAENNKDFYEHMILAVATNLESELQASKPGRRYYFDAVETITGKLTNLETGSVSSAGRKIIKTPVTQFNYGSSTETALDTMAESFIEMVYDRIQNKALGKDPELKTIDLIKAINLLRSDLKPIPVNTTAEDLKNIPLSTEDRAAMKSAFKGFYRGPLDAAIQSNFGEYINQRNAFTKAANATNAMYVIAYKTARAEVVRELAAKGDIKTTLNKKGDPVAIHDLSYEQELEVERRVQIAYPRLHSLFSKESNQKDAAMYMGRSTTIISKNSLYKAEVLFNNKVADTGSERIGSKAMERIDKAPGVAMSALSIQSLDSYISHEVQKVMSVQNQHDAVISGVGKIRDAAELLNATTWDALFKYSPTTEMLDGMTQTILGIEELVARNASPDMLQNIGTILQYALELDLAKDRRDHPAGYLMGVFRTLRNIDYAANVSKFAMLSQLGSIDQYTFEGGAHLVTDEQRAEAAAALETVKANYAKGISPRLEAAILRIQEAMDARNVARVKGQLTPVFAGMRIGDYVQTVDMSYDPNPLDYSSAVSFQLLETLINNFDDIYPEIDPEILPSLKTVQSAMYEAKGKKSIEDVLTDEVDADTKIEITKQLRDLYKRIPQQFLSSQGSPNIESDPEWVAFFEQRGTVSGKQLVKALRAKLTNAGGPKNIQDFNLALLKQMEGLVSPDLTIKYVTPATAPEQIIAKAKDDARAWYIATVDGRDVIYILSPDFLHSGVTTETLMHEILHAAVSRVVFIERQRMAAQKNYRSPIAAIIRDLDKLLSKANSMIKKDASLHKYFPAVQDLDELMAWGMTNTDFQRDVLAKIEMESRTNKVINGVKALVDSLVGILFRSSTKTEQEILSTGLSVLIANVSTLMTEAAKTQERNITQGINQSQTNTESDPATWTTDQIYEDLGNTSPASAMFDVQLRGILNSIVNKLYGPVGAFYNRALKNQAMSPRDAFIKALETGNAPFASKVSLSGFKVSEQELFTIEHIEATVAAAISRDQNTQEFSYKEIYKLYTEAKSRIKPTDFHDGDWATATAQEKEQAQEKYDFLFKINGAFGDLSDHLSRFVAMGLASEQVSTLLGFTTDSALAIRSNTQPTMLDRLRSVFEQIMSWLKAGLVWSTQGGLVLKKGEPANDRLINLVDRLVSIEAKKRASALRKRANNEVNSVENRVKTQLNKVTDTLYRIAELPAVKNSGVASIRSFGAGMGKAAKGRLGELIDDGMRLAERVAQGKSSVLSQTVAYAKGTTQEFEELFRMGKAIEAQRKEYISRTAKNILTGFANNGKDITEKTKEAVSAVLLRGDVQSLLDDFSLDEIAAFLSDNGERSAKIKELEAALDVAPDLKALMLAQVKALGFKMATGKTTLGHTVLNAHNIANSYGTIAEGRLTSVAVDEAIKTLDPLISLYAIEYSKPQHRQDARDLMVSEKNRPDGENGVELTLYMHRHLLNEAKAKNFDNNPTLMIKGFTPDVLNPSTELEFGTDADIDYLSARGYIVGNTLPKDPNDPDPTVYRMFILKDAGMLAHPSGMLSNTGEGSKGTKVLSANRDDNTWTGQMSSSALNKMLALKKQEISAMLDPSFTFDPTSAPIDYLMTPLFNSRGKVVNYRYMMQENRKDEIFERKNQFEHLLGVMAGTTFDKVASKEHNKSVIKALKDFHAVDFANNPKSYVEVGPNSIDLEMREIYRLLPDKAKEDIRATWNNDSMMIRKDMVHLTFGYRKYSLSNIFDKADRNALENIFGNSVEFLLASYARTALGMNVDQAERYTKRAAIVVKRAEDTWKALSDIVKNNIVMKSGIVLVGNLWSDATLLMMQGVSLPTIAKYYGEAFTAAKQYQQDSEELYKIQMQMNADIPPARLAKLEERVLELKNSIARNPATVLMAAGLNPTIAQDIDFDEDAYAYKKPFERKLDVVANKLENYNPVAFKVAKHIYMTKDTPHYRMLSEVTQLSNFVARYTMYHHFVNKPQNPMSKKEAIFAAAETFVNYDIPLPPALQYLDDMGILPFTKYFLSIQRIILNIARDNPVKALLMTSGANYFDLLPTVMDSSIMNRISNNPLYLGPLRMMGTVENIMPIKAGLSLFK